MLGLFLTHARNKKKWLVGKDIEKNNDDVSKTVLFSRDKVSCFWLI